MITISGHCRTSNLLKIQTSVKASNGRFVYCYESFNGKYCYSIQFESNDDYTMFNTTLDILSAIYSEKNPSNFKKIKNKIIGTIKQLFV